MRKMKLALAATALCFGSMAMAEGSERNASTYESAVLTFSQGSHMLNTEEMSKLREAVNKAKAKGTISRIEVAAWSDKEHPMTGQLPKADRELAEKRIETIKQDLRKDDLQKHARAYNMAENAHWIGRHMHSSEAELDAVFAKKEKNAMVQEDFQMIKNEGAPSKAVVIFRIMEK